MAGRKEVGMAGKGYWNGGVVGKLIYAGVILLAIALSLSGCELVRRSRVVQTEAVAAVPTGAPMEVRRETPTTVPNDPQVARLLAGTTVTVTVVSGTLPTVPTAPSTLTVVPTASATAAIFVPYPAQPTVWFWPTYPPAPSDTVIPVNFASPIVPPIIIPSNTPTLSPTITGAMTVPPADPPAPTVTPTITETVIAPPVAPATATVTPVVPPVSDPMLPTYTPASPPTPTPPPTMMPAPH